MKSDKNSTNIFWHRIFKSFADAMIKVFIPFLIFKETGNMYLSILYCLISYCITGILFIVLKKFITRFPVLCIIIQIVPLLAIQFLISNLNIATIIIIAVLDAIATTLYFGGLNLIFGLSDEKINTAKFDSGEHIGRIFFIALSATLLGEVKNSLTFITIFAGIMYVLSAIPLLLRYKDLTKDIHITSNTNKKEVIKNTKNYNIYHTCFGVLHIFLSIFLPLYLYLKGLSFTVTGLLMVFQEVLYIAGAYTAKQFLKIKKEKLFLIIDSVAIGICAFVIIFLKSVIAIYILTLVISFFYQGICILLLQCFIDNQKQKGYFQDSIFYRDVFQNFGRSTICGIYIIGLFAPVMFIFGILSSGGICFSGIKCLSKNNNKELSK